MELQTILKNALPCQQRIHPHLTQSSRRKHGQRHGSDSEQQNEIQRAANKYQNELQKEQQKQVFSELHGAAIDLQLQLSRLLVQNVLPF